mgnify:CR=1 FL=1
MDFYTFIYEVLQLFCYLLFNQIKEIKCGKNLIQSTI